VPVGILTAWLLAWLVAQIPAPARSGAPAEARLFTDVLGHRVEWRTPPRRIVSLSPNLTEILFAIGCDTTRIVGVTRFCNYPPVATKVTRVGGIVDPSLEAIVVLRPDLVLATRGNPLEFLESLTQLGIPVYALEDRGSLARIFRIIAEIGQVTGQAVQADSLVYRLQARVADVARRTSAAAMTTPPRVYFGELEGALWTAGPGSYIGELIRAAGGENVAADAPSAWSALSLEAIVTRDPQVYLGTFAGDDTAPRRRAAEEGARRLLATREGWRETQLGRRPRVFMVQEDRLLRPGPRVVDVLEEFARFLHPHAWEGR
jgi:iron complex transport system substrate-binding protein